MIAGRRIEIAVTTATLLFLAGVAALVPGAVARKDTEYRLARWLATSGLSPVEQATLIAGAYHASRFDPAVTERELVAAATTTTALEPAVAARLEETAPHAASDELAAVLARVAVSRGWEEVLSSLERGALGRELAASEGREARGGIPAFLWQLADDAGWSRYPEAETELLDDLRALWVTTRGYRQVLPRLQARQRPTAIEYALAVKDAIVRVTGVAKWLLHFLLGALAFATARAFLRYRGASRRRAGRLAFVAVVLLALGVELADWTEAAVNHRSLSVVGSIADAVVTCLAAALWLALRRRRARARPRCPPDEPVC